MSRKVKEMNGVGGSSEMKPFRNGTSEAVPVLENGANSDLKARKAALTPLEYRVTQQRETERPFSNKYNKHWENGTYHCIVCDAELFKSETKFESKSGWPAFYNVVDPQRVKLTADLSHVGANLLLLVAKPDLARTEVSCANCNAHLGHLFKDGPKPTGLRYCINSSSLQFKSPEGIPLTPSGVAPSINGNANIGKGTVNGNGNMNGGGCPRIQEFACNPDNMCSWRPTATPPANTPNSPSPSPFKSKSKSLASTPTTHNDFCPRTARESFFSSLVETPNSNSLQNLPPMGALCLNNQPCPMVQQVEKPPLPGPEKPDDFQRSTFISNGAENHVSRLNVNLSNSKKKPSSRGTETTNNRSNTTVAGIAHFAGTTKQNSSTNHNPMPTTKKSDAKDKNHKDSPDNHNDNQNDDADTHTSRITARSRFAISAKSKGASLTAARINFFQKIASRQESPSPSRWASTFNSRWSSANARIPGTLNTQENCENGVVNVNGNGLRFPSSISSGSLCTSAASQNFPPSLEEVTKDVMVPQPRRSASSFFSSSSSNATSGSGCGTPKSINIEQVISAPPRPVPLRETTL